MPHKTTDTDDLDTGRTSSPTATSTTTTTTSASTTATHQTNPTAATTDDDDNPTASTKSAISTSPPSSSPATHHRRPNTTTNTAPPKRTTIPLADGWTLISTTKSQQHRNRKNNKKGMRGGGYSGLSPAGLRAAHEPAGPAKLMPGASKEWLMDRLVKFRERWAECACRRGIEEVLERAGVVGAGAVESVEKAAGEAGEKGGGEDDKGGGGKRKIRNAVCIGLGSLSVDNIAAGVRSMWQLVCFLDIVGMLSESAAAGEEVKMYAEDPVFNTLDEEIFEELGITVVKGLRSTDGSRQEGAAQFIEPDSLIFAPFMPSFIMLEDFLAGKDPAIYIGNDVLAMLDLAKSQVRYSGDVDERTRRCIQAAEEFLAQGREVVALPEFDLHEHALAGQMIYWRKPTEES
ncbi:uncharacterized protein LTHEOB_7416 [Lasiodiplodia theobromae]|uniref:uncharacterized protein n=1 Tax=Lasiodiplodia theobromae TaxID=45133 RepID=UPI0015C33A68|nr:uncharacterized protein LTHEOB_7416 [Lasiodiplodia theobromae]KAF4542686.1 hypothetical protein LTHEOB_7416 [Lasiodiplodia theobromae]